MGNSRKRPNNTQFRIKKLFRVEEPAVCKCDPVYQYHNNEYRYNEGEGLIIAIDEFGDHFNVRRSSTLESVLDVMYPSADEEMLCLWRDHFIYLGASLRSPVMRSLLEGKHTILFEYTPKVGAGATTKTASASSRRSTPDYAAEVGKLSDGFFKSFSPYEARCILEGDRQVERLSACFIWSSSPQGFSYWLDIVIGCTILADHDMDWLRACLADPRASYMSDKIFR